MADTIRSPKAQLALELAEFGSRFQNLKNRISGTASYRPLSNQELETQVKDLAQDLSYCFAKFLSVTPSDQETTEAVVDDEDKVDAADEAARALGLEAEIADDVSEKS